MIDRDRYTTHARRIELMRQTAPEPLASYWAGYRQGMARTLRDDPAPQSSEEEARDRHVDAILAGDGTQDLTEYARHAGYHDGRRWDSVTQHRGLLRLAIAVSGQSNRAFARHVLRPPVDEANVRQMLAGTRPVPANRRDELLDLIAGQPAGM